MKVCLNNKLVKHRFVYIEEWAHILGKPEESDLDVNMNKRSDKLDGPILITDYSSSPKVLRGCYFGKFVNSISLINDFFDICFGIFTLQSYVTVKIPRCTSLTWRIEDSFLTQAWIPCFRWWWGKFLIRLLKYIREEFQNTTSLHLYK